MLGKVGLEGHAHTIQIKNLSGGQKARVVFAELILGEPHIIFFDEPTNHLDIESVDALAEAILNFEGGVVLVSHDARLIQEVGFDLWVCDNNEVVVHPEGFNGYRDELLEEIERQEYIAIEAAKRSAELRAERKLKATRNRRAKKSSSADSTDPAKTALATHEKEPEKVKPTFDLGLKGGFKKKKKKKAAMKLALS